MLLFGKIIISTCMHSGLFHNQFVTFCLLFEMIGLKNKKTMKGYNMYKIMYYGF